MKRQLSNLKQEKFYINNKQLDAEEAVIHTLCQRKFNLQIFTFTTEEKLMTTMFYYDMCQNANIFTSLQTMLDAFTQNPQFIPELQEVMNLLCEQLQTLQLPIQLDFPCPLKLHAHYT